jgi:hypothetical protein
MGFLLQNNQFSRQIKCLNKNSPYISVAKVGRSAAEENLNKLQTVHNFATRTVTVTRKPSQDKEKFRSTRKIPPNENRLKWQYPLNYRFIFGTRSWRTNLCIATFHLICLVSLLNDVMWVSRLPEALPVIFLLRYTVSSWNSLETSLKLND